MSETFAPYMEHGTADSASVLDTLNGALELLGANGENWTQGELRAPADGGGLDFCVVGALEAAAPNYESYASARELLKSTIGGQHLDRWNNRASFSEVKQALETTSRAIFVPEPTPLQRFFSALTAPFRRIF